MKKRLLFLALTVAALCALFALTASAETQCGDYYYEVSQDGTASIVDVDFYIDGDVVIPSTLDGYSVTSIGYMAFSNCSRLTSVKIPSSVTSIGDYAFFRCSSLTSIEIPDSVTTIGDYAFSSCSSLTRIAVASENPNYADEDGILFNKEKTVLIQYPGNGGSNYTIPSSVTSIGKHAFEGCDCLTSVTIMEGVTSISYMAFSSCSSLVSVTISSSVTSIDAYAFQNCSSLTSVKIPSSVTSIDAYAFSSCSSLTSFSVDSQNVYYSHDAYGVLFNKNKSELIQYPIGNARTNYTIPSSVTRIGNNAFYCCSNLMSIEIPDSVTIIGDTAFAISSLTSITIPHSVIAIGSGTFLRCNNLISISVSSNNAYYASDEYGVLFNKSKTELLQYPIGNVRTSYIIPDGVTTIGYPAFRWCNNLKYIIIPDGVTTISSGSFLDCNLTGIFIPRSVISIDSSGGLNFVGSNNLTIYGQSNSYAEAYAKKNYIPFAVGALLTGHILSYGSANDMLTVELLQSDTVAYSSTITGSDTRFNLIVPNGTYTLRIRKPFHLDYTIAGIVVDGADVDLTKSADPRVATINMVCGDLNGDGAVNVLDVAILRLAANYGKSTDDCTVTLTP